MSPDTRVSSAFVDVGSVGGIIGAFFSLIVAYLSQSSLLLVGPAVSASFLFLIGTANSVILWRIIMERREVRH